MSSNSFFKMTRKNISDITYTYIESFLYNKTAESDVLDYKEEMIDDQKLVKHVCAFANTPWRTDYFWS